MQKSSVQIRKFTVTLCANLMMSSIFCLERTCPVGFPGFITTMALQETHVRYFTFLQKDSEVVNTGDPMFKEFDA